MRRSFLKNLAVGTALAAMMTGCAANTMTAFADDAEQITLRMAWWGSQDRHD